ncbi:MAG: DUF4124 domain-containing protein [Pseudomonadales bacterium]
MKILLTVLLTLICYNSYAEIYKWTDNKGVVHYGDRAPTSTDGSNTAVVTTVEISPINMTSNGKVSNPKQAPAPDLAQFFSRENMTLKNLPNQQRDALALIETARQYVLFQLKNIIEQINIWRGASSNNPVITNDSINNQSTTAALPTNKVEIYTAVWCGACKKAKQWLHEKNIPFQEYDVGYNQEAALRMKQLGGGGGIPFAIINGTAIEGFSSYRYASALHK